MTAGCSADSVGPAVEDDPPPALQVIGIEGDQPLAGRVHHHPDVRVRFGDN